MGIFRKTKSRDLWLAAGNLLAVNPPPGFVRALLGGAVTTFSFRVVSIETQEEGAVGGGCAEDFFMTADEDFRDWPKARMYQIIHGRNAQTVFAPGIHPVGFNWWKTTDYRDPWEDGDCSKWTSEYWRTGLIAQLLDKKISDLSFQPAVGETVLFTSAAAFEQQIKSAIERASRALEEIVGAFVQSGELTLEDSAAIHLACRVQVVDERPLPHADLPKIAGKWCAVPPGDSNSQLP